MNDDYKPTLHIKWFRVDGNYVNGEKPLAQIAGYRECGPEWYCLKQLWVSENEEDPDEWRDIDVID